ncbi:unnamed protein product [Schistocephalus solidus]|uniref:Dynein heavy chain 7, axonemal n=1 Tax=Schistocephalus solidus TaxID=70667 RepID=A0A183T8M1_SCHSO|nr:unnamed protein product [Schistocephalus solidus]
MDPNCSPSEASDRLNIFQARFDELWRKYETYSGGQKLFGMPVGEYAELQQIRKELGLLQKLYQLYNAVLETVNGYYDIPWNEINIENIKQQLLDFQAKVYRQRQLENACPFQHDLHRCNQPLTVRPLCLSFYQRRCRKLPKALKEWPAYETLQKTIDDFNETCPLLEMMVNKAMALRHWERIENLTKHKLEVDSENFLLRNLMEAPLLKFKEDIEDICVSAVKERDIEAKLKGVINDWSAQSFAFSTFRNRGELLLKGDQTNEIVALLEDSLMVLGGLLSNRYNAPFKQEIQDWVQKLSTSTEIIENILQEAKRFANIDKSWQRIMQRAHEMPNVISCCAGDDTLVQLLPHMLEQLEICQKSLTGYLEKKRLVFPRFFFVSDPALLEILGQASDPHTIQSHLLSVFDNTKTVTFDEKVYDKILAVNSQEGETIPLQSPVMAQGHVECWLGDLLKASIQSLHQIIKDAYYVINSSQFQMLEFENTYVAQVGLLGIQLLWTRDAEAALLQARSDKATMQETNQRFLDILNKLIAVTTQELTKNERTKYETLITIHVHQKDIFDDLVKMHIRSPKDFEWLKQSRFYFSEELDACLVKITDVDFIYQNEFLGCTDRLVITPLTDR